MTEEFFAASNGASDLSSVEVPVISEDEREASNRSERSGIGKEVVGDGERSYDTAALFFVSLENSEQGARNILHSGGFHIHVN